MADVNTNNTQGQQAEPQTTQTTEPQVNNEPGNAPDVNELIKEIAELKVELSRNKKARDKALSEAGEYKKQLRERMSVDEQAEIEKKEAEEHQQEYIASLEKFKAVAEATARYALQGMDSDMAKQAADAEINGDMDALADIQKKYTEQALKKAEAEWLKSRPQTNVGGSGVVTVTQEQFNNMGMVERTKLYNEQPDVYKALLAKSK